MKSLKKDTLAYQLGVRPYTQRVDHTSVPVAATAGLIKKALGNPVYPEVDGVSPVVAECPEADALRFYFMNHAVAVASTKVHQLESLGRYLPIFEEYNKVLAYQTRRMFYYLLIICTRESRHNKDGAFLWNTVNPEYKAFKELHTKLRTFGSMEAASHFYNNPPDAPMGLYTTYLTDAFFKGSYSSSFGGKPWGEIANVLRKFVHGEISAEMMLDTSYTLCHNNGPIFNKGMFYGKYGQDIYKILDVQRSGQIPHLINEGTVSATKTKDVRTLFKDVTAIMGHEIFGERDYVDWFQVEAMGSLHKYHNEKQNQTSAHGEAPASTKKLGKGKLYIGGADVGTVTDVCFHEEPTTQSSGLEIMPGVFVEQVEMERE